MLSILLAGIALLVLVLVLARGDAFARAGSVDAGPLTAPAAFVATPETGGAPVTFVIAALPQRETYVSLRRQLYLPGAELAQPTVDGPTVVEILSGNLTLETAAGGATAYVPPDWQSGTVIESGVPMATGPATIVVIPAGVPVNIGNRGDDISEWLMVQVTTPPTICACGQDLSLIQSEILASMTLEQPIAAPATLSLAWQRLEPGATVANDPGVVRLVGIADSDAAAAERSPDGAVHNAGSTPLEVLVISITGAH